MKNFLKYTVIILGLLIVILFTIMVIAIFNKYNKNSILNQNIDLNPKIKFEENIKDYFIEGSRLYILVETDKENAQLLQVYDLNTGKKLNRIKLR
tara:strand:- start:1066 stop:1350 length:285 start_codon:yes stop_codon:yes gene_type:complete